VPFGRSRESRTCEAAGRRNWPEAVPRKMRGRKRGLIELDESGRAAKVLHTQRNCVSVARAQFVWLGHYDRIVAAHGGLVCLFSPSLIQ
jgi:hypothetical protein